MPPVDHQQVVGQKEYNLFFFFQILQKKKKGGGGSFISKGNVKPYR